MLVTIGTPIGFPSLLAIHGEGYCTVSEKVKRVNTHPFGKPGPRRVDMVEKISQVSLLTQYGDRYSLHIHSKSCLAS